MTVTQPNALDDPGVLAGNADATKDIATKITQSLFNKLFALPTTAIPGGLLARLPPPIEALPRAKPVPKPKPLTKWQQFAKEKGIVKKKKSKMEFDEVSQQWKRSHGYGRANDPLAVPIIDAEEGDQVPLSPNSILYCVPMTQLSVHPISSRRLICWTTGIPSASYRVNVTEPAQHTRAMAPTATDDLPISCPLNGKRSNGVYPKSCAWTVAPATSTW